MARLGNLTPSTFAGFALEKMKDALWEVLI
jgi:hypothetical protein